MVSISHLIATLSCFDFSVTSKHDIPSSTRDFSISDGSIVKKIPVEFPPFNFGWSRKASIEPTSAIQGIQGPQIVKKIPVESPKVFFGRSRKTSIESSSTQAKPSLKIRTVNKVGCFETFVKPHKNSTQSDN